MKLSLIAFGIALGAFPVSGADWEQAYPVDAPLPEELPILSMGWARPFGIEVLIGSRSGYLVLDSNGIGADSRAAFIDHMGEVIKLPLSFDITAIHAADNGLLLGGSSGQISVNRLELSPPPGLPSFKNVLLSNWETRELETKETVEKIRTVGDRVIAQAKGQLFLSADSGDTWSEVTVPIPFYDIESFLGAFYGLGPSAVSGAGGTGAALFRSMDGINWSTVWDYQSELLSERYSKLFTLSEGTNYNGIPYEDTKRLYVQVPLTGGGMGGHLAGFRLINVSSSDGDTWLDNFSEYVPYSPSLPIDVKNWNPLEVPEGLRYVAGPAQVRAQEEIANNYRYTTTGLSLYRDRKWVPGMKIQSQNDLRDTIAKWDALSFMPVESRIFRIKEGQLESGIMPQLDRELRRWQQLVDHQGTLFAVASMADAPSYMLFRSDDFITWESVPMPGQFDSNDGELIAGGPLLAALYKNFSQESGNSMHLKFLDGGAWSEPVILPGNTQSVCYHAGERSWYCLVFEDYYPADAQNRNFIERIEANGQLTRVATFIPKGNNYEFRQLVCPDGERLVAFGSRPELYVLEPDGTSKLIDLQEHGRSQYSETASVSFVNGWFYLAGENSLRTRDFTQFEEFDAPAGESLVEVIGHEFNLYAFSSGSVFRRPMERGYLDSIAGNQGWRQSSWLGWFQILDQKAGQINHLLLGNATISRIDANQYWMDTDSLGRLYVRADWMPWFHRESNGHWYWLDQGSWPPRAWDSDTGEWIDL